MLLDSFEFNFHSVSNNIKKVTSPTKQMHSNYWKCNHVTKKQQSIDTDARPCNMDSEGNNIFPRSLSVNVKEVSGIFLKTLWFLTNLHRCTLARILILHPDLREAIIFGARIAQKNFYGEMHFSHSSSPLSGSKSWQWPKVNLVAVK